MRERDRGFHCSGPGITGRAAEFPRGACSLSVCGSCTQLAPPRHPLCWSSNRVQALSFAQTLRLQKPGTPTTKFKDCLLKAWKEHGLHTLLLKCPLGSSLPCSIAFIQCLCISARTQIIFPFMLQYKAIHDSPIQAGIGAAAQV